ncbi:hypothetical protein [Microbispora sp. NPDC049125]|uniref:hypothetical protein n=1 Tax=Microbispora sp. NPDC049125 TaxID=3154929 RepID=UPI00346701F2
MDVAGYALECTGDDCTWTAAPYRGGMRFIVPGPGRDEAIKALEACGYTIRADQNGPGFAVIRYTPKTAPADTAGDFVLVECPLGGHTITLPNDAVGALAECDTCPWRGTVGDPEEAPAPRRP